MNLPYIICHMVVSADGKVTGRFLEHPDCQKAIEEYYNIHRSLISRNSKNCGFICGRKTMEESFTRGQAPRYIWDEDTCVSPDEPDFIGSYDKPFFAVAFDSHARLGWNTSQISDDDPGYDNAHIIEVITREVDPRQLDHLRNIGVSYIFAGHDKIDVTTALEKLAAMFNIDLLLLEGGSDINNSFQRAGVIDKLSLVTAPIIAPNPAKSLFGKAHLRTLTLDNIQNLDDVIWTTYYISR